MKSFTDIEQSEKLAEFLPLETADMHYWRKGQILGVGYSKEMQEGFESKGIDYTPCWSLAALLNYLREIDFFPNIEADEHSVAMNINYYNEEEARPSAPVHNIEVENESFIDACYEMIIKLHELNLL